MSSSRLRQNLWDHKTQLLFKDLKKLPFSKEGHYVFDKFYLIESNNPPFNIGLQTKYFHPNLLRAYDCLKIEDKYFTLYPLLESTHNLMSLDYEQKYAHLKTITGVIAALHSNGIVHGDIQLKNLIVNEKIHLIDLELLSKDGTLDVNFLHVPELVLGGKITKKTDIYMLCSLLYEVLNEIPTPRFNTPLATITYQKTLVPEKNKLNTRLFNAVAKGLVPNPIERYIDAQEIYESF